MMKTDKLFICKKYLSHIFKIMSILIICAGISYILNFMYVKEEEWERILWHNFYEDQGKIDNLYLGSSHVYCDVESLYLDEITGLYNFNLSSSSQMLNASYYLLKEADKKNNLSHVYLELYYLCSTTSPSNVDPIDEYYSTNWRNTDYMKMSWNKFEYIITGFDKEKYIETFFPFSRYRAYLDDWEYIKKRMQEKKEESYLFYEYYHEFENGGGCDEYRKQGYLYSTKTFSDKEKNLIQLRKLGENPIGKESEEYLRKIISYCQKRDIPITLFVSPTNELMLVSTEGYDNYLNQLRRIVSDYGVDFYDFNLVKEEYLPIHHLEYFRDIEHLNAYGANLFTAFFYDIVSGNISEKERYFYKSYSEKLQTEEPAIYGIYYRNCADEGNGANFWYSIASNRDRGMEYKIIANPSDGEEYLVQDFSENKDFLMPADEHGTISIIARVNSGIDDARMLKINY